MSRAVVSILLATLVAAVSAGTLGERSAPAAALIMPLAACPLGFTGVNCDVTICQSLAPCLNNGTCYFNADGSAPLYLCVCPPGYTGTNCEILVDNCALAPRACENGGTCVNLVNDYKCTCPPGYNGFRCQNNIDDCALAPCGANGCCTDRVNNYTCTCNQGWTGRNCQTPIQPCTANPCLNGATCTNLANGNYACTCPVGYVGNQCQQVASVGNQRCFSASGSPGFVCYCLPGFFGTGCTQGSAASQYTRDVCTYTVADVAAARLNWLEASTSCSLIGATLTSVTSTAEGTFLKSIVTAGRGYWLGLRLDVTPIRWTDGSSISVLQWAAQEPLSPSCVMGTPSTTTLLWNTADCGSVRSFICKRCAATTTTTTRTTTRTTTKLTTTKKLAGAVYTTIQTTYKVTTTRPTTRTTAYRARRDLAYRAVMLAGRVCFPSATPTNLDVVAVNALTGQVITNFTVQLFTTTFGSPISAFAACDANACNAPCARFYDPTLACRVCVCNPTALALTRLRDPVTGVASFALPPLDLLLLQASATGFINVAPSKLVFTRPIQAGHVLPLYPSPLATSGNSATTVLITLTWLDDGLSGRRDFDSYLRTSYKLPTPTLPAELCTVYPGSNCNQGTNSAAFVTSNARVGLFPSPYSGVETIRVTATSGLYQHIVYGHAADSNFAGSNARVEVLVISSAGTLLISKSIHVDVDGASSLACGSRRFWNTFLVDLRGVTPAVTTVNTLDCAPSSPVAFSAVGVFPNFPNENGPRTCC